MDGITNKMFTQEIGRTLAAGDVSLGAAGRTKEAAEKGGSLVARALGINPAVAETLVKLADPASNELQDARIAATRPESGLKIDLELVKQVEPRTFIVVSLGAKKPVAQGVAVGESRTMFGVGRTAERIAAPRKEQFEQYQEVTLHHSGAVVGWSSSEPAEMWSEPPTEAQKHALRLEPVVYLEKDTRSTATIETKNDKKNSVERSTLSTVITEATVMNEGSPVYLKDPTGKLIMRRNAEGVLAPVEEKVPAFSVEVKTSRKETGLPATVQFVDPVTKSTTAVGIHVQDGMLRFGYEKTDELSRAGADGKVAQEEKHISYRLDDAYLSFTSQGQLQAVLGDPVRSPHSTGRLQYRTTEDGKEVIGAEVPTLNAVVTLDKLNALDPEGPLVISIKPRSQSGVPVPLNERDGSLQPVVFRVKGYETTANVPLVMDAAADNGVIEVSSAGVKVNLKAAQTGGKGNAGGHEGLCGNAGGH